MKQLLEDIADLYDIAPVGGPLHIVLDDGNVDDESIRLCLDTCTTHWSVAHDPENADGLIELVHDIGTALLSLSVAERERLYEERWGRSLGLLGGNQ